MISDETLDRAGYLLAQRLARINYLILLAEASRLATAHQRWAAVYSARREAARWGIDTDEIDRRLAARR